MDYDQEKKLRQATCPHCDTHYVYDLNQLDELPDTVTYNCGACEGRFSIELETGKTAFLREPFIIESLSMMIEPFRNLDHHIEVTYGHKAVKWLQETLNTSKYHLGFGFMSAGLALLIVHDLPLSLLLGVLWLFLMGAPTLWLYGKIQEGAGEIEPSTGAAALNPLDAKVMRLCRSLRISPLFCWTLFGPFLLLTLFLTVATGNSAFVEPFADAFMPAMGLIYCGLQCATAPYVPPSGRITFSFNLTPAEVRA